MNAVDAVGHHVDDLVGSIGDARLFHAVRVIGETVQNGQEALRQGRVAEPHDAANLPRVNHGHDARRDGNADALRQRPIEKAVENIVVKHHLSGQEIRSGVLLAAQIVQIGIPVGGFGCPSG